MKKLYRIALAVAVSLATLSCNKENSNFNAEGYSNQGTKIATESAVLTPYQQKEKLESAGKALIAELDMDHWKETADFIMALSFHIAEIDSNNGEKAFEAFNRWAEEVSKALYSDNISGSKETVVITAALSALKKGTFTEKNGVFEFTEGPNLQIVTYLEGKPVTVTLTNGTEGDALLVYDEQWKEEGTGYPGEITEFDGKFYVKVPKWVKLDIMQGSTRRMGWESKIKVSDTNGNGRLDLGSEKIELGNTITLGEYEATSTEVYGGTTASAPYASANMVLYHNGKCLIATAAETVLEDAVNFNNPEPALKTVKAAVDVLGQVQLKGNLDYSQLAYFSNKLDPYAGEADFLKSVENLESCMDLAVYYDRKDGRQAWLGMEPLKTDSGAWTFYPVIRFSDETSYAPEEFFNEDDFRSLINAIGNWIDKIDKYFY